MTPPRLDFSVTPAYYQTNWFRALCVLVFLAMLWATYQSASGNCIVSSR